METGTFLPLQTTQPCRGSDEHLEVAIPCFSTTVVVLGGF